MYFSDGVGVNANDIVEYNTVTGGSASVDSSLLFFKGDPTVRYNNFVIGSQDRLLYADTYSASSPVAGVFDFGDNWLGTTNTTNLDGLIYDWNDNATLDAIVYSPILNVPNTTAPPIPPTNVAAQTGTTSIALTWAANVESDIAGYKIYYDTDQSGYPYANSVDVGNVTSHTLSGLNTGTTYYTAVAAYDSGSDESWVSDQLTVVPQSVPTSLSYAVQPAGATAGAGFTTQPVVHIKDLDGTTVTSATNSVTLSITSGAGTSGATLIGTATVSAVNGVATFSGLQINTIGTGYTLTATSSGLTSAASSAFNVSAGAASNLVITSEPSTTVSGDVFSVQPVIQIRDAYGNVVTSSSAPISVSITSGTGNSSASLSGSTTVNAVSGVATFTGLGINQVGAGYTLTFSSSGLTSAVSSGFNIIAYNATALQFLVQPTGGTDGSPSAV